MIFNVTESAIKKIQELKNENEKILKVSVLGGGCSGFKYNMEMVKEVTDEDIIINEFVVIDSISEEILEGSELDYKKELVGSYFSIKNPNASSGCGCGESFGI